MTTTSATSPGGITGQLPVTKVGALIAGDALAILNGNEIRIERKVDPKLHKGASSAPPKDLLTGVLLQTKLESGVANGYVVFNAGERFARINSNLCPDRVTTLSGTTYTGIITVVTPNAVTISTSDRSHTINCVDIAAIHSARAFLFKIANADGQNAKMDFITTCPHSVLTAKEHRGNIRKKVIIVALSVSLIACAIAIPVALATSHHHSNNNNIVAANLLNSRQQVVAPPAMPAGTTMPTPQQLGKIYLSNLQQQQASAASSSASASVSAAASSSSSTSTITKRIFHGGFNTIHN